MHPKKQLLDDAAKLLLAELEGKELTARERNQIPLQEMATQDPSERILNMNEVALGYTEAQVRIEAMRCLQCKTKPCVKGCPVGIDIPAFIHEAEKGNYAQAVSIIKESSLLPSVCGRVCPQELQCQMYCTVGKAKKDVEQSVSIGRIERFVADYTREHGLDEIPHVGDNSGKSVAIVGSGPASISAAADLRREGHRVVLFEALHKAGGVLVYGIPEFRLPKEIVEYELEILRKMGVEIRLNYLVGKTRTVD
ncbi:MAG TPA: NAD(P)-binding protein, partial [Sphaerochaeta sp.]|nr:NAD(P)-binding protein [Sphaerochaeta sp.]